VASKMQTIQSSFASLLGKRPVSNAGMIGRRPVPDAKTL
jgi:hypothetical protein